MPMDPTLGMRLWEMLAQQNNSFANMGLKRIEQQKQDLETQKLQRQKDEEQGLAQYVQSHTAPPVPAAQPVPPPVPAAGVAPAPGSIAPPVPANPFQMPDNHVPNAPQSILASPARTAAAQTAKSQSERVLAGAAAANMAAHPQYDQTMNAPPVPSVEDAYARNVSLIGGGPGFGFSPTDQAVMSTRFPTAYKNLGEAIYRSQMIDAENKRSALTQAREERGQAANVSETGRHNTAEEGIGKYNATSTRMNADTEAANGASLRTQRDIDNQIHQGEFARSGGNTPAGVAAALALKDKAGTKAKLEAEQEMGESKSQRAAAVAQARAQAAYIKNQNIEKDHKNKAMDARTVAEYNANQRLVAQAQHDGLLNKDFTAPELLNALSSGSPTIQHGGWLSNSAIPSGISPQATPAPVPNAAQPAAQPMQYQPARPVQAKLSRLQQLRQKAAQK